MVKGTTLMNLLYLFILDFVNVLSVKLLFLNNNNKVWNPVNHEWLEN